MSYCLTILLLNTYILDNFSYIYEESHTLIYIIHESVFCVCVYTEIHVYMHVYNIYTVTQPYAHQQKNE